MYLQLDSSVGSWPGAPAGNVVLQPAEDVGYGAGSEARRAGPYGATGAVTVSSDDAWHYHTAGSAAYQQGDFDTATSLLERSRALFDQMGDRAAAAWCSNNLAKVAYRRGDYEGARKSAESSLQSFRGTGDRNGIAWSLHMLGRISYRHGDYAVARTQFQESADLFRAIPSDEALRLTLEKLGKALFRTGNLEAAFKTYTEALERNRDARDDDGVQVCLDSLLHIAYKQDKPWLTDLLLSSQRNINVPGLGTMPHPAAAKAAEPAETAKKERAVWNQCLITLWKELH